MLLGIEGIGTILFIDVATHLDARVKPRVALDLQLEHEILVVALAEKRVRTSFDGGSHDRAVLDLVRRETAVN